MDLAKSLTGKILTLQLAALKGISSTHLLRPIKALTSPGG